MSSSPPPDNPPLSDRERDWLFRLVFAQTLTHKSAAAILADLGRCFTFTDEEWRDLQPSSPYLPDPREGAIDRSTWARIAPLVSRALSDISAHIEDLHSAIQKASPRWRLDRMPVVDRAALTVGCYELLVSKARPARRVINRTVELAKRYGEADTPRFVNGILDQIRKNHGIEPD